MIEYLFSAALLSIGVYALLFKENFIKKVIGLSVMTNGIHLLLISLGFSGPFALPPVLNAPLLQDMAYFSSHSVDPLPQALVLTSIVINVSITALALALAIHLFKQFDSLDCRLVGEDVD